MHILAYGSLAGRFYGGFDWFWGNIVLITKLTNAYEGLL